MTERPSFTDRIRMCWEGLTRKPNQIELCSVQICKLGERIKQVEREVDDQLKRELSRSAAMKTLAMCYYSPENDGVFIPACVWDELKPVIQEMAANQESKQ